MATMSAEILQLSSLAPLQAAFGERLLTGASLARYSSARIGGPADILLEVRSAQELAQAASILWELGAPMLILGGGSNVLISDAGVRGVVIINNARQVQFNLEANTTQVWVESGANLGLLARQAAAKGLGGLAWAAGIPGTLGGAVVGNAGAHGGDLAGNLILAEILHLEDRAGQIEEWNQPRFEFGYRSSVLKRKSALSKSKDIVLSATLKLERSSQEAVQAEMDRYVEHRRRTQPPGASMGSMFKNPPGDFAGRLIDAAGLKGLRRGNAEISSLHGNFFVNLGNAAARDVQALLAQAQAVVEEKFGIRLELEVELVGEWDEGLPEIPAVSDEK